MRSTTVVPEPPRGLGAHVAAQVADHEVDEGQAEADPATRWARREERIEHVRPDLLGDPGTVVLEADHELALFAVDPHFEPSPRGCPGGVASELPEGRAEAPRLSQHGRQGTRREQAHPGVEPRVHLGPQCPLQAAHEVELLMRSLGCAPEGGLDLRGEGPGPIRLLAHVGRLFSQRLLGEGGVCLHEVHGAPQVGQERAAHRRQGFEPSRPALLLEPFVVARPRLRVPGVLPPQSDHAREAHERRETEEDLDLGPAVLATPEQMAEDVE